MSEQSKKDAVKVVAGSRVVSEPGAAIRVELVELTSRGTGLITSKLAYGIGASVSWFKKKEVVPS